LVADFVKPEALLFFWKNTEGDVACSNLFESPEMQE
jgi:hypothetical protein